MQYDDLFIKFPSKLLLNVNSAKFLLTYWWCNVNENKNGIIKLYFSDLIKDCGYAIQYAHNKSNDIFKGVISYFFSNQLLEVLDNSNLISSPNKIKISQPIYCKLVKNNFNLDKFQQLKSDFVICSFFEIVTILNSKNNHNIHSKFDTLLRLYFYLKSFIPINCNQIEICFPSISFLSKNLSLSRTTVINSINDLIALNLIFKYNLPENAPSFLKKQKNNSIYSLKPYQYNVVSNEFLNRISKKN